MNVVWASFQGRWSDNTRALYEGMLRRGTDARHTWLARPSATFPATPIHSRGIRALKSPPLTWARNWSSTLASISSSRVSVPSDM